METSCGPPWQGQHVTMTTPFTAAAFISVIRSVLESGILPLPYVTMATPFISGCRHPLIYKLQDHSTKIQQKRASDNASSETQGQIVGTRESLNRQQKNIGEETSRAQERVPGNKVLQDQFPLLHALHFLCRFFLFHCPFRLSLTNTICPFASEDANNAN